MAWAQYDAGDYAKAADSFARVSCTAKERAMYAYYEGLAWKVLGKCDHALRGFSRAFWHYADEKEPSTEIPWAPMALVAYMDCAAEKGRPQVVLGAMERYGAERYHQDNVRWVMSVPKEGVSEDARIFRVLSGEAPLEEVGTYELARAYAKGGNVEKMREILNPALEKGFQGTLIQNGKALSLEKAARKLQRHYDGLWARTRRFLKTPWSVALIGGLFALEMVVFGPALWRKFVTKKS